MKPGPFVLHYLLLDHIDYCPFSYQTASFKLEFLNIIKKGSASVLFDFRLWCLPSGFSRAGVLLVQWSSRESSQGEACWESRLEKMPKETQQQEVKYGVHMIYVIRDMNLSALFHFNMCSVAYSLRIIVLWRQIIPPNHKVERTFSAHKLFIPFLLLGNAGRKREGEWNGTCVRHRE